MANMSSVDVGVLFLIMVTTSLANGEYFYLFIHFHIQNDVNVQRKLS